MIVVRDVFQLQFGKAREAVALLKEGRELIERSGYGVSRVLTDVVGEYYTLIMESEVGSLSEFEAGLQATTQEEQWRDWYGRFTPLVRSGRREIFRVVE